ncbi:MAG: type II toxin-antitoxin system HicB family antitoxin [Candidatus Zambryskibacteria bacterium]|nr:type II toxin-antitoxin system HicB family antitoxin [Candidatus Zambryskibacteria bacterium]
MKYIFTTTINKEGKWYVAHCVELGVASQGKTIEEAQANIKEAVELYLEDAQLENLPKRPSLITIFEVEHVQA